ncbi:MAG: hypothetical protein ACSHWZ_03285 [Sulfitobacter sp.]
MQKDWILDVLADLRNFATVNQLPALAEQLEDTAIVALAEIAATAGNDAHQSYDNGQRFSGTDNSRVKAI